MKKFIILALVAIPYISFAQAFNFIVKAKIANATAANKGYLLYYQNGDPVFATAKLEKGEYIFTGKAPEHFTASFFLDDKGFGYKNGNFPDVLSFRLENGIINILATDSVKNGTATAGPFNKDYAQYKSFMAKATNVLDRFKGEEVIALQNGKVKELDQLHSKTQLAYKIWVSRNTEYVKSHPNSYSSIDALAATLTEQSDFNSIKSVFDRISAKIRETSAGKNLNEKLQAVRNTKVGVTAPLFTLADTSGKVISLNQFKGKYVLIDFWASWCHPCREENPNYIANYKKYHPQGLEILGVTLDKLNDKDKWLDAIHKDGLLWPQVINMTGNNTDVAKMYYITSIPRNFLLNPEGRIIATDLRGDALGKKLSEIFGSANSSEYR